MYSSLKDFALWTAYGVGVREWPLIITNGVCFLLAAFILVMTLLPHLVGWSRLQRRDRFGQTGDAVWFLDENCTRNRREYFIIGRWCDARRENDWQTGVTRSCRLRQLGSRDAGQADIGDQQIDRLSLQHGQSLRAIAGFDDLMPEVGQHIGRRHSDQRVVFDQQNPLGARPVGDLVHHCGRGLGRRLALWAIGQNMAQPPCQCLTRIGLAEELDPGIDASAMDDGVVGIARREEDGDLRKPFARLAREFGTAQRPRH